MEMGKKIFKTSDIALAAFLYCSGADFLGIDRQNPRRCVFLFDSPDTELILKWQKGEATVNGLTYHNAYQELKARIFRGEA